MTNIPADESLRTFATWLKGLAVSVPSNCSNNAVVLARSVGEDSSEYYSIEPKNFAEFTRRYAVLLQQLRVAMRHGWRPTEPLFTANLIMQKETQVIVCLRNIGQCPNLSAFDFATVIQKIMSSLPMDYKLGTYRFYVMKRRLSATTWDIAVFTPDITLPVSIYADFETKFRSAYQSSVKNGTVVLGYNNHSRCVSRWAPGSIRLDVGRVSEPFLMYGNYFVSTVSAVGADAEINELENLMDVPAPTEHRYIRNEVPPIAYFELALQADENVGDNATTLCARNHLMDCDVLFLFLFHNFRVVDTKVTPFGPDNIFASCTKNTKVVPGYEVFLPLLGDYRFSLDDGNFFWAAQVAVSLLNSGLDWLGICAVMKRRNPDLDEYMLKKYIDSNYLKPAVKIRSRTWLTIAHMAMIDNRSEFYKILGEIIWTILYKIEDKTDDIYVMEACAYRLLWNYFVTAQGEGRMKTYKIYKITDTHLELEQRGEMIISNLIMDSATGGVLNSMLLTYKSKLRDCIQSGNPDEKALSEKLNKTSDLFKTFQARINKNRMIGADIASKMADIQANPMAMDVDPHLTATENCLLELCVAGNNQIVLPRVCMVQDYITRRMKGRFDKSVIRMSEPKYHMVINYLNLLYENRAVREWVLSYYAYMFYGRNKIKGALFAIGPSNSGKTAIHTVLREVFGGYGGILPAKIMASLDADTDKPQPALKAATGSRVAHIDEPSGVISNELFKSRTGEEACINQRTLYGTPSSDPITYSMIFTMNNEPEFTNCNDGAILTRTYVIRHATTFYHAGDAGLPKQQAERVRLRRFQVDSHFQGNMLGAADVLLTMMVLRSGGYYDNRTDPTCDENPNTDTFEKISLATLTQGGHRRDPHMRRIEFPPQLMVKWRNEVLRLDPLYCFVKENTIIDASGTLPVAEAYDTYCARRRGAKPVERTFVENVSKLLNKQPVTVGLKRVWPGVRLRLETDPTDDIQIDTGLDDVCYTGSPVQSAGGSPVTSRPVSPQQADFDFAE